jgi:hypothetical protein
MHPTISYSHKTKTIPVLSNHRVVEYNIFDWTDSSGHIHLVYEPVYERIHKLQTVYWYKDQRVFLVNDEFLAYDCEGNTIKVDPSHLKRLDQNETNMFFVLLSNNGFTIEKGELVSRVYYFPEYATLIGFQPRKGIVGDSMWEQYKNWGEAYEYKQDCINWCNHLNSVMRRKYPTITE